MKARRIADTKKSRKEEVKAADAAMFDVRGWKARPLLSLPAVAGIRYGRFDVDTDGIAVIGNSQVEGESS
jgi:hypothetical protein